MSMEGWEVHLDSDGDRLILTRTERGRRMLGPLTPANAEWVLRCLARQRQVEKVEKQRAEFPVQDHVDPMCVVLAEERVRQHLEAIDIARLIADDGGDVLAWESGVVAPKLETLRAWAYLLGYEPRMVLR